MKVLITGSSGQIGTNVGLALQQRGEWLIRNVSLPRSPDSLRLFLLSIDSYCSERPDEASDWAAQPNSNHFFASTG